ncbi:MAG: hypothetical protein NVSMB65_01600 [Chloroflexota bacterium]
MRERPVHLTAADVYDVVRQHDPRIAFATVYNALHYLVDARLIAEVRRPDGVTSYDRETRPHEHVLCRACGAIADVRRTAAITLAPSTYDEVATQTGYLVEHHRVEFVGVCPTCRERATALS